MKVLTLVITRDYIEPLCLGAIINQRYPDHAWLIRGEPPFCDDTNPFVRSSKNCAHNREAIRKIALASDAEFFMFLDSDVVPPIDAVDQFMLQRNMPVQGGWYKMKNSPRWVGGQWVKDNVFAHYYQPMPSVVMTDLVGLGCCFVSRAALSVIQFEHGTDKQCLDDRGNTIMLEECAAFSNSLINAGFPLYLNGSVVCEHITREHGEHFDHKL